MAVEGAGLDSVRVAAPSTMLRMVPLPRDFVAGEDADCECGRIDAGTSMHVLSVFSRSPTIRFATIHHPPYPPPVQHRVYSPHCAATERARDERVAAWDRVVWESSHIRPELPGAMDEQSCVQGPEIVRGALPP